MSSGSRVTASTRGRPAAGKRCGFPCGRRPVLCVSAEACVWPPRSARRARRADAVGCRVGAANEKATTSRPPLTSLTAVSSSMPSPQVVVDTRHPAPAGKGREVEKAGMQQRFAPTLKMGPEAATQQGPQGRDHLGRHGARAPYPRPEWYGGSKCNAPNRRRSLPSARRTEGAAGTGGVAQLPPEAGPEGRFIQWIGPPAHEAPLLNRAVRRARRPRAGNSQLVST